MTPPFPPVPQRREIVNVWREGISTMLLVVVALLYPERATVAVLSLAAIANLGLAVLTERDAKNWHKWADSRRVSTTEDTT